jgi:hypothetical protein
VQRKLLIIILLAVASYVGWTRRDAILAFIGRPAQEGPIRCDYAGKTYEAGQQRAADDGCNVCTCGPTGWSCTVFRCAEPGTRTGTIAGALGGPEGTAVAQRVCAFNLKDDKEYCVQRLAGAADYAIKVPVGNYWVYASQPDVPDGFRAYWSEAVSCGLKAECKDHSPITVEVEAGGTIQADPIDWGIQASMELFNITPSKWEYSTHNTFPNSVFHVKTRNMESVVIMATPYPPQEDAVPYAVGQAARVSTERGIETWDLAVPAGFEATDVWPVGTDAVGAFIKGRPLRIVRPVQSASTTVE